jgi:hypothetical protein
MEQCFIFESESPELLTCSPAVLPPGPIPALCPAGDGKPIEEARPDFKRVT